MNNSRAALRFLLELDVSPRPHSTSLPDVFWFPVCPVGWQVLFTGPLAGRGWRRPRASAHRHRAFPRFSVPQRLPPLPDLPVCVNRAKVNWVQPQSPRRVGNNLEKNDAQKEMEPERLGLSRVILMTKHSGHFDADFNFWGMQRGHAENPSNKKSAVTGEGYRDIQMGRPRGGQVAYGDQQ